MNVDKIQMYAQRCEQVLLFFFLMMALTEPFKAIQLSKLRNEDVH